MTAVEALVSTFLVNALWQTPLLAAAAGLGAGLLRRAPAAYRHRLWIAALSLSLLAPLASALRARPATPSPHGSNLEGRDVAAGGFGSGASFPGWSGPAGLGRSVSVGGLGRAAVAAYGAFLVLGVARLLGTWRRTRRWVRGTAPAPASLAAAGGGRTEVRLSSDAIAPLTFGMRDPVIVLPSRFAREARARDLRGVLAHEEAHVVRRDWALNLVCEILALPVSFHPAVSFMRRRIRGSCEAACDEAAAARVGARAYAEILLNVALAASRRARVAGALGVLDGDSLEDRVKRILDPPRPLGRSAAASGLAVAVLALALAGRVASGAALRVEPEGASERLMGRWAGQLAEGALAGRPAADLTIRLTSTGPEVSLTLYRYLKGSDGSVREEAERLDVVRHEVQKGTLRFRTHTDSFRIHPEDPPSANDTDWEFVVVGEGAGELRALRSSKHASDKARGRAVPPPPPPLPMRRLPED